MKWVGVAVVLFLSACVSNGAAHDAGTFDAGPTCTVLDGGFLIDSLELWQKFQQLGCTEITGSLWVQDLQESELPGESKLVRVGEMLIINRTTLTKLPAFPHLRSVGGIRIADNESLISVHGLEQLESTQWSVSMSHNKLIANAEGLNSLASVGAYLEFEANENLETLHGLEALTVLSGDLMITGNGKLQNLTGLDSLHSIGGSAGISSNPALASLVGLDSVTTIHDRLWLGNNSLLPNMTGLGALASVEGGVTILGQRTLHDFHGLEQLQTIGGTLEIKGNDALANLTGLTRLEHVGGLSITYNQLLPTCFATAFSGSLGLTSSTISNNSLDCP